VWPACTLLLSNRAACRMPCARNCADGIPNVYR
jgi:hypothetical protein